MAPEIQTPQTSRRSFLRGKVQSDIAPLRPPWTDEQLLIATCTRCEDCVSSCPENVLVTGDGGYPAFDPKQGYGMCTFCGDCAKACDQGSFDTARDPAWTLRAEIASAVCLAEAAIHCETCRDSCDQSAIDKIFRIGKPPRLQISVETCNGCGACMSVCPADAVRLVYGADAECAA